ncbi:DUF3108 domain-containing protein [Pedobacter montanisoli]|uniref:DUF4198 domain-containing protein n=1 Tax=Pedobacter montanisoli TaxID=2923277 RepID=A0ABS9ZV54_9SPHI|nr:hypothetical protein [Pedobacter montanisoli]MCJ0742297.1 hypothetical protein [Pedobacter montanisoli]
MKKYLFLALIICSYLSHAQERITPVNAQNKQLKINRLKYGETEYLVYLTDTNFNRIGNSEIWKRKTSKAMFHGKEAVKFDFIRYHKDSLLIHTVNYCDLETLAPIYHVAQVYGKGVVAYNFEGAQMKPADTVAHNGALKRVPVNLTIPVISWEQDMETYPLLPITKVGQKFNIAFFDPNEQSPSYHTYEVYAKEDLTIGQGIKAKCWILKIDYGKGNYALFWLHENDLEVLKMKEYFNGKYRFKVKLY